MKLSVQIKTVRNLSNSDMALMNKWRAKRIKEKKQKNFKKDYLPNPKFFFVKNKGKIVSFGILRTININYLGKRYSIMGFCSIISIVKGKGYGKILMQAMIKDLKRTGKTGLGFCGRNNLRFYGKAGLKTKKGFIKRFVYKNPKTGEEIIDNEGDGIYYEGKDKFISKVLSNKKPIYINVLHW